MKVWKIGVLVVAGIVLGVVLYRGFATYLSGDRLAANIPLSIVDGDPPDGIAGSFEGRFDSGGHLPKLGGGCLIFQDANQTYSCSTEPCPSQILGVNTPYIDVVSYCVTEGVIREPDPNVLQQARPKSCWFQAIPDTCIRGINIMQKQDLLKTATRYPLGTKQGMRWRVLTCQKVSGRGCNGGDLGTEKDYRYGPIREY